MSQNYSSNFREISVKDLEGFIISEISESQKTKNFIFETEDGLRVIVYIDKTSRYFYGDKMSISGDLKVPEAFKNNNGLIFDYKNYLLKDGIIYNSFYPEINLIEKSSKRDFKYYIFSIKEFFSLKSKKIFKSETSTMVLGIILGIKDSIPEDLENNFRRTGLIHIVVLSGFNLTIIAYFVFKLLSGFHRNIRYLLSLIFIFLFVVMVGAGATIVRAGIMISIFIFSKLFRRNTNSLNTLLLAGSIMVFLNPMILVHDTSFQLSFMATLGLISFYPYIDKFLFFLPNKFSIKEIIVSNISVQITVIPLLIYLMGEFSIISLLPNIIVLPLIPFFMLVSFLAILISFISSWAYLPLVFITEKISSTMVSVVDYFGNLPFAVLTVNIINTNTIIIIVFVYLVIIFYLEIRKKSILKKRYNYLLS